MANDLSGDDFSHTQTQDAQAHVTNGEYRVKLPDGRVQIVSYTADKDGYKAEVKYTESTDETDNPKPHPYFITSHQNVIYQKENNQVTSGAIDFESLKGIHDQLNKQNIFTEKSGYMNFGNGRDNYPQQGRFVSKEQFYKESLRDPNTELISGYKFQVIPEQKVRDGIHGQQKVGKFIESSLNVYPSTGLKDFQQTSLSSITPHVLGYSQLHATAPNFRWLQS